eukprot:21011-Eustigmatos_ZCMA.PRE.1
MNSSSQLSFSSCFITLLPLARCVLKRVLVHPVLPLVRHFQRLAPHNARVPGVGPAWLRGQ